MGAYHRRHPLREHCLSDPDIYEARVAVRSRTSQQLCYSFFARRHILFEDRAPFFEYDFSDDWCRDQKQEMLTEKTAVVADRMGRLLTKTLSFVLEKWNEVEDNKVFMGWMSARHRRNLQRLEPFCETIDEKRTGLIQLSTRIWTSHFVSQERHC